MEDLLQMMLRNTQKDILFSISKGLCNDILDQLPTFVISAMADSISARERPKISQTQTF